MITPGDPIEISISELLENVSELEIAKRYVTNFRSVGVHFKSDIRIDNRVGSCVIFMDRATGRLKYKDFADPRVTTQIDIFEYVAIKFNLSVQGAVNKIASDFNIKRTKSIAYENIIHSDLIFKHQKESSRKLLSPLIIKIKQRDWTKSDIEYWKQYSIPISLLERNNVKSISHLWLIRGGDTVFYSEFTKNFPVFSYDYYWNNDIFRRKIYRPMDKGYKWLSNTDSTIVQNYPNVPKGGELLFIQSSYKDCMVMELMDYYAIAPNTEIVWLPSQYWEKTKKRWKKIILFANNDWDHVDNPGLAYAEKHSKIYNVPYIYIHENYSDISDYVKEHGLEKGKELVERLIEKI